MSTSCITWDEAIDVCSCFPEESWHINKYSKPSADSWETGIRNISPTIVEVLVREIEHPLAHRFYIEADKWSNETIHLSSPTQKMLHPSYQAILGLANENKNETINLMLQDLKVNRRPWFWALSYLTKENPIKKADIGKMDKMIQAWTAWGKKKGYL